MINVNEYFGGAVKSLGFDGPEGRATIGIISKGEYEFGTDTIEYMTVIAGVLAAQLPGESAWKNYNEGETFVVAKGVKFKVKAEGDVAYRCYYK